MLQVMASVLQHSLVSEGNEEKRQTSSDLAKQRSTVHPAAEVAARLFSKSKNLVERYSSLSNRVASSEGLRLNEQDYEEDAALLKSLMMKRDRHLKSQVQRLLSEAKNQSKKAPQNEHARAEKMEVWDALVGTTGETGSMIHNAETITWGMAAGEAKKAVKRLVKHLPEEG